MDMTVDRGELIGSGKPVFGGGSVPTALRLTDSVTYPNGTVQPPMRRPACPRTATSPLRPKTYNASPEVSSDQAGGRVVALV
jgi:hypothetical protein